MENIVSQCEVIFKNAAKSADLQFISEAGRPE